MNPQLVTILFYILIIIGLVLLLVLLYTVLILNKEIDKSKTTWLVVSFICIIFPVVGNMTIEYGEFKLSLTRLSEGAKEMEVVIQTLEEDNTNLQGKVEELNSQISRYRSVLLNPVASQQEKAKVLDSIATRFDHIEKQSVEISRNIKNAGRQNEGIIKSLDKYQRVEK